jgi:hypothetical protein
LVAEGTVFNQSLPHIAAFTLGIVPSAARRVFPFDGKISESINNIHKGPPNQALHPTRKFIRFNPFSLFISTFPLTARVSFLLGRRRLNAIRNVS